MVMETVPFLRVCLCVCVLSFIYLFGHCDAVKQQAASSNPDKAEHGRTKRTKRAFRAKTGLLFPISLLFAFFLFREERESRTTMRWWQITTFPHR